MQTLIYRFNYCIDIMLNSEQPQLLMEKKDNILKRI